MGPQGGPCSCGHRLRERRRLDDPTLCAQGEHDELGVERGVHGNLRHRPAVAAGGEARNLDPPRGDPANHANSRFRQGEGEVEGRKLGGDAALVGRSPGADIEIITAHEMPAGALERAETGNAVGAQPAIPKADQVPKAGLGHQRVGLEQTAA
jgi:hypothetical protein